MHLGHISYPLVITSLLPRYLQLTTFTVQSLPPSLLPPPTGHEDLMITLSSFFMIMPVTKNQQKQQLQLPMGHTSKMYSVKAKFFRKIWVELLAMTYKIAGWNLKSPGSGTNLMVNFKPRVFFSQ